MDSLDPWAILYTQEEWALHIPQPISTNMSLPVTTTTTRNADNLKRVTVGFQPQPLVPQPSPSSPALPTAGGTSVWPLATLKWPTAALDIRKRDENEGKCQFGILSKTGTPSDKKPRTVVETDGRWSRYHPPDDLPSRIGPPSPPASISAQNCANLRTHSQIWHTLGSPSENHCKPPRLPPGNVSASNATLLDVFRRHSEPASSISSHRHSATTFPCALDPPASKSTQIDAFSCVSNSIRLRTGLPHLSTSIPTRSDASWLNFEPNPTILTPGPPRTIPEPMALAKWPNEATMTLKHDGNEWVDEDKLQLGVSKGKEWQELENPRNADGDSSKWSHNHFTNA